MKGYIFALMIILIVAIAVGLIWMPSVQNVQTQDELSLPTEQQGRIIEDSWIIVLKPEYVAAPPPSETTAPISGAQLQEQTDRIVDKAIEINETISTQGGNITNVYTRSIHGFAVQGVSNPLALLADPAIETVEPNVAERMDSQVQSTGINRIGLNQAITTSLRPDSRETKMNVDVAVIDSLVWAHPDLYIFSSSNFEPTADTADAYHGTHVAGLCCARDNLGGVVGPAQGARIWALRVCYVTPTTDGCPANALLGAFDYVIANAAQIDVVTMSVGGGNARSDTLKNAQDAVVNAGIPFFQSAGNEGMECEPDWGCANDTPIVVGWMSDFDGLCGGKKNLVSTSGETIRDDVYAPNSNYGSDIDIIAPGSLVLSTFPGTLDDEISAAIHSTTITQYIGTSDHGSYATISGTSMSTPLAAGVGAILKSINPSWTPAQVKSSLQSNDYSQTLACDGKNKGGFVTNADSRDGADILWAGNY